MLSASEGELWAGGGDVANSSPFAIVLTPKERAELERIARKRTLPHREVIRAKLVLLAAAGLTEAAATYLGIAEPDLRTKLQSGQRLAQIAAATSGKTPDGLIQALVADRTTKIGQAQKDGKLTADQAAQLKQDLTQRVTRFVDANPPLFGPGGVGFGFRPGGHPGR